MQGSIRDEKYSFTNQDLSFPPFHTLILSSEKNAEELLMIGQIYDMRAVLLFLSGMASFVE